MIRHGETEYNKEDKITGQKDIELTDRGREQAEKLAKRLKDIDFNSAYSSDLKRTLKTTRAVAEKHNLHVETSEDLRERSFGKYEGKPKNNWKNIVRKNEDTGNDLAPKDGESLKEAGKRFLGKLDELKQFHQGEDILVGGHGVAIKATILQILDLEGKYYSKLEQNNTAITELNYSEEKVWKIIRMNDFSHLE